MATPIKPGDFVCWDGVAGQVREGQFLGPAPGAVDNGGDYFAAVRSHNAVCHIRVSALCYHPEANVDPEEVLKCGAGLGGGHVPHTLTPGVHFEAWLYKDNLYLVYTETDGNGSRTVARYIGPGWRP